MYRDNVLCCLGYAHMIPVRSTCSVDDLQVKIFGGYTRWATDVPAPDQAIRARMALTSVDAAFRHAMAASSPGPVHLNMQFREPLAPTQSLWHDTVLEVCCRGVPQAVQPVKEGSSVAVKQQQGFTACHSRNSCHPDHSEYSEHCGHPAYSQHSPAAADRIIGVIGLW